MRRSDLSQNESFSDILFAFMLYRMLLTLASRRVAATFLFDEKTGPEKIFHWHNRPFKVTLCHVALDVMVNKHCLAPVRHLALLFRIARITLGGVITTLFC